MVMVMGFLSAPARDPFWRQQNRILVGDLLRTQKNENRLRKRDRTQDAETGLARSAAAPCARLSAEYKARSSVGAVVREPPEPPLLISPSSIRTNKQGYLREGSNKRGRLTHTSIQ